MMSPREKPREAAQRHIESSPEACRRTLSGIELRNHYGPDDLGDGSYQERLGDPGAFPYTRGVHADMYRGKPWTMRMFAGFGTPDDTNRRFRFLL